jgi:hypothetical protein
MSRTAIVGIDPGLVDTGVVSFTFDTDAKHVGICFAVEPAFTPDSSPHRIAAWIRGVVPFGQVPHVFIEKYNPRPGMQANTRMQEMERSLMQLLPHAERINNMGIKNVITQQTMELFQVWRFSLSTHHQDLRSAARIALYGAVKDPHLNHLVADLIGDQSSWSIDVTGGVRL